MNAETIVNLVIAIVSLIPTLVSVICLIVNIIKNKNWDLVKQIANSAMSEVEVYAKNFPGMTSQQKLDKALEIIENSLRAQGITFDSSTISKIISYIQEMCSWSKTVNAIENKGN